MTPTETFPIVALGYQQTFIRIFVWDFIRYMYCILRDQLSDSSKILSGIIFRAPPQVPQKVLQDCLQKFFWSPAVLPGALQEIPAKFFKKLLEKFFQHFYWEFLGVPLAITFNPFGSYCKNFSRSFFSVIGSWNGFKSDVKLKFDFKDHYESPNNASENSYDVFHPCSRRSHKRLIQKFPQKVLDVFQKVIIQEHSKEFIQKFFQNLLAQSLQKFY